MTDETFNLFNYFFNDVTTTFDLENTAIDFHRSKISYRELKDLILKRVDELAARGINERDRVAVLLADSPDFIISFFAVIALGAIAVPINTFSSRNEVDYILTDCGAKLLISEKTQLLKLAIQETDKFSVLEVGEIENEGAEMVRQNAHSVINRQLTQLSPAFILYTSGSTGLPKGALHSHGDIACTIETYGRNTLKLGIADRVFSASRLFFAYGLGNSLSFPLSAGATVILESERPTPQSIGRIFLEKKPTVFFGVPSVFRALLDLHKAQANIDTSSLRLCVSAGEALPAQIFEEWYAEFGLEILDGIGSTEMLHIFISNRQGEARAGSTGIVVEGYEARLIDEAGGVIPKEGDGHLWVKGGSAMLGYWHREDLTDEVCQDGWLKTGDIYHRDASGYFYHVGRSDDCFKVKGLWVSPVEVESALLCHPDVVEAAVVAGTDAQGLATARAFIVIRKEQGKNTDKQELLEFAKSKLATYKVPTLYEFIKELPRTSTGKVQRFKLRTNF
jgi:benzoate-CoA ligase